MSRLDYGSINHVLANISEADAQRVFTAISVNTFEFNKILSEPGGDVDTVYFPVGAVLSVLNMMEDGRCVESSTIGREGAFGLIHAMGAPVSLNRVVVQVRGDCLTIPAEPFRQAALESPPLLNMVVRHIQAELAQTGQGVACNALHEVEPRLCRWLLMTQDRMVGDVEIVPLTHEYLALMLGIHRTSVTVAARALQRRGLIDYARGKIHILSREGLEQGACECYAALRRDMKLLF